jgi:5-methylcytosine-specific restriction protein A
MLPIERARKMVLDTVLQPAIDSNTVTDKTKNNTRNQKVWLRNFDYVGDLLDYLERFDGSDQPDVYKDLKKNRLKTYEDLYPILKKQFSRWSKERTRLDDYVVGNTYKSHSILISAKTYDTRGSGILPVGNKPHYDYIVIKATLKGGKYPNEWLDQKKEKLKYFFKDIKGKTKRSYKENAAILNNPTIDIYVFVRENAKSPFIFEGKFVYLEDHEHPTNGSMWFVLSKAKSEHLLNEAVLDQQLNDEIKEAMNRSPSERKSRLKHANKKPEQFSVTTTAYKRNPDVIAEVLLRAKGICEKCLKPAPFNKRKNGEPYLEVHHKKRLADNGDDTIENALALCPNCHREAHFG